MFKQNSNTDIRWLSLNNAIQPIYRTYRSLVKTLFEESQQTKHASALGLHSFLTNFLFCAFLCLLVDVLNVLTKLCKTMQSRDLLYSYVKPKIAIAIGEIKGMKNVSGLALKSFEGNCALMPAGNPQKATWRFPGANTEECVELKCSTPMVKKFSSLKNQYLQSLADNLERRLPAHARDGKVLELEALSQLTSPKCLLEY